MTKEFEFIRFAPVGNETRPAEQTGVAANVARLAEGLRQTLPDKRPPSPDELRTKLREQFRIEASTDVGHWNSAASLWLAPKSLRLRYVWTNAFRWLGFPTEGSVAMLTANKLVEPTTLNLMPDVRAWALSGTVHHDQDIADLHVKVSDPRVVADVSNQAQQALDRFRHSRKG